MMNPWWTEAISSNEFFELVQRHEIPIRVISQVISAPIKELITWGKEKPAPLSALVVLKKFLGVECDE